ncbi:MAG: hypothetical protein AB7P99_17370 [Vicinamibacterales bacterium]
MPPRFVYWTIIAGGMPTAFRATDREELLPTFQRIREKHPDAEMKYFAQGKLWAGPEEARAARLQGSGDRSSGTSVPEKSRGRSWRPGGEHRDARQHFKDQKKERNQRWRAEKFEKRAKYDKGEGGRGKGEGLGKGSGPRKFHGDPLKAEVRPQWPPSGPAAKPAAPKRDWKPSHEGGPQGDWRSRPPKADWRSRPPKPEWRERPHGDPMRREARPNWKSRPPSGPKAWGQKHEDKPPRGPRPDREPRRGDEDPKRPPRADEPRIEPPGPPERGGRPFRPRTSRPAGKGPRRR